MESDILRLKIYIGGVALRPQVFINFTLEMKACMHGMLSMLPFTTTDSNHWK